MSNHTTDCRLDDDPANPIPPLGEDKERLCWRANLTPGFTTVKSVRVDGLEPEERYVVTINGYEIQGRWTYEAAWYLLVGAQHGGGYLS